MKFILSAINFLFLLFCFTNVYCDDIKMNDIKASTTLPVLTATGHTFSVSQITDGITSDASPFNGFSSPNTEGTITLEFGEKFDLISFHLWNDVNVNNEGIRKFRLDFFDESDTLISESQTYTAKSQLSANDFIFNSIILGVKKVNLIIITSSIQIEIRELEFKGEKYCSCIVDSDKDGVIDQWDNCPNTPKNSPVLSDGCHIIKGDVSNNGKLDIEDSIKILQSLTTTSTKHQLTSCKAILDSGMSKGDGIYRIDPDGIGKDQPYDVYCDMTTDGGGWTYIANISDAGNDSWSQLNDPSNSGLWEDSSTFGNEITFDSDYKSRAYNEVSGNALLIKANKTENILQSESNCLTKNTFREFISSLSWNAVAGDTQWNDASGAHLCDYSHFGVDDTIFNASTQTQKVLAFKWGEKEGVQDTNKDRVMITVYPKVDYPKGLGSFTLYHTKEIFEDANECYADTPSGCGTNSNQNYQLFIR